MDNKNSYGKKRYIVPAVLIAVGAVALCYGIFHGEAELVMQKAINICLECIGIG